MKRIAMAVVLLAGCSDDRPCDPDESETCRAVYLWADAVCEEMYYCDQVELVDNTLDACADEQAAMLCDTVDCSQSAGDYFDAVNACIGELNRNGCAMDGSVYPSTCEL